LLELVAPSLRKRIDFHLTYYRGFGTSGQEFWITLDRQVVFSASYGKANIARYVVSRRTRLNQFGDGQEPKQVEDALTRRAIHDPRDVTSSIRTYFDLDPQVSLTSSDPVLRGLAVIDRRIGTRTLQHINLSDDEHPLVRLLYDLRIKTLI
jgi:hypothetical protein